MNTKAISQNKNKNNANSVKIQCVLFRFILNTFRDSLIMAECQLAQPCDNVMCAGYQSNAKRTRDLAVSDTVCCYLILFIECV